MTALFNRRAGLTLATLVSLGLAAASAHAQTAFTAGNIVISVVGDGVATLANTGNPVSLEELTTSGTLVQSIAVTGLVSSGTATSEGALTLSQNGQFLTVAGYNASQATSGSVTSSTTIQRGIAEIGTNGAVSTSFFTDGSFSGNNIRSAVTTDGTTVYATGGSGDVRTTTFGSGTSTAVEAATANTRVTNIANGNLYFSTGSGTSGIYSLGTVGTQTATTAPTTVLATGTGSSPYDFFFASPTTLFVADDRTTAAGGLLEYTSPTGAPGSFTLLSTFNPAAGAGLRGLTGNSTDIFGVATNNTVVDFNIATSTFSTIFTGAANTAIRGVDFAPAPAAVPEASTTVSFGLLLALGLGGFAVSRRRKVTAN